MTGRSEKEPAEQMRPCVMRREGKNYMVCSRRRRVPSFRRAGPILVPPAVALKVPWCSPINAFIMGASWPLPTLSMSQPELPTLFPQHPPSRPRLSS